MDGDQAEKLVAKVKPCERNGKSLESQDISQVVGQGRYGAVTTASDLCQINYYRIIG